MGEVLEAYPSALFVPDTLGRATLRPLRPAVSQTESCEGAMASRPLTPIEDRCHGSANAMSRPVTATAMSAKNFAGDISISLRWSAGDLPVPITQLAQTRSYVSVVAHTRRAQGEAAPFSF